MTTATTRKTFGKVKTLRLTFEEKLAQRLERVCRNLHAPVWKSGGFQMTSAHALCRVLGLGELRDYQRVCARFMRV